MRYPLILLCVGLTLLAPGEMRAAQWSDDLFAPYRLQTQIDEDKHDLSILSLSDRRLYRRIFALGEHAEWTQVGQLISQIENPILLGQVTFQRLMHPTGYRSKFTELAGWLDSYADHPGAIRVYRLASKRRPAGNTRRLRRPSAHPNISALGATSPAAGEEASSAQQRKTNRTARAIQWRVKKNISEGWVTKTWERLKHPSWRNKLSNQQYVQSLGDIAKGYVIYNVDDKAIKAANEALQVDSSYPSQAYWWGGLAAWRRGEYSTAVEFFTFLGNHPAAQPEIAAAANFWAWRTELRLGRITRAHQALIQATQDPYGFYGQLARYVLGVPDDYDWTIHADFGQAQGLIAAYPVLQRTLALAEVGEYARAQAEISRLKFDETKNNLATLMLVADRAGMANFALKLGRKQVRGWGKRNDVSRYPLPRWQFLEYYSIDRALLYALIHKESRFLAGVKSSAGAQGLMQIMPGTARMMQKRLELPRSDYRDPAMNLTLGQEYLKLLLTLPEINDNLIYTLAGYNAGPGRLRDWREKLQLEEDPLLFIETIPVRETRRYIEIVLGNLWIYRKRLGQATPSLATLLEGKWPLYQRLDLQGSDDAH